MLLHIDPDADDPDQTLEGARQFVADLARRMADAQNAVVAEFLNLYNDGWRDQEEPRLTSADFLKRLSPTALYFIGAAGVDIMFSDGGLFAGHSLIAESFDGSTFGSATMYG